MSTLRSFYRDTRALSPVVATILLVAIAVIASVLTYLWATGFIGAIQTRPSQTTETIHVQAGSYTAVNGQWTLYISNAGTQNVMYVQVFLLNSAGTSLGTSSLTAPGVTGTAGSITTLTYNANGAVALPVGTQGQIYILQVVTAKGTSAEIQVTAA